MNIFELIDLKIKLDKDMTKIQNILIKVEQIEIEELEILLKEVIKKIEETKRIDSILEEYVGIGEGVWKSDGQEYINELREESNIAEREWLAQKLEELK